MGFTRYDLETLLNRLVDIQDTLDEIFEMEIAEQAQTDLFLVDAALNEIEPNIKTIKRTLINKD